MSEHSTIVHTPVQDVQAGRGHWGDESTDKRENNAHGAFVHYIFYLQCQVPSLPPISTVQIPAGTSRPSHMVLSLKFSLTVIPVQTSVGICP